MNKRYMGITEGGDAGLDFQWLKSLKEDNSLEGAIIITKRLNENMIKPLLDFQDRVILHLSVTGYAETSVEPNTPSVDTILEVYKELLSRGFSPSHVVLRIDPIIPTNIGLKRANKVLCMFADMVTRVRVSVLDLYPHARERFEKAGLHSPYGDSFQASSKQFQAVDALVTMWKQNYPNISFECCAEPHLKNPEHLGCISAKDYKILKLNEPTDQGTGHQRETCCCLGSKKELLGNKQQCLNGCLYCYWKDAKPTGEEDEILMI